MYIYIYKCSVKMCVYNVYIYISLIYDYRQQGSFAHMILAHREGTGGGHK